MRGRAWKWIGLGAIAAIAVGSAVAVERRRRQTRRWNDYDTDEIRDRLRARFAALPAEDAPRDFVPFTIASARRTLPMSEAGELREGDAVGEETPPDSEGVLRPAQATGKNP